MVYFWLTPQLIGFHSLGYPIGVPPHHPYPLLLHHHYHQTCVIILFLHPCLIFIFCFWIWHRQWLSYLLLHPWQHIRLPMIQYCPHHHHILPGNNLCCRHPYGVISGRLVCCLNILCNPVFSWWCFLVSIKKLDHFS